MGIALQLLLNLKRQTLHAPAHVGVTHRDPDAASRGDRDHGRSAFNAAAIADDGAPAWMRTRASFNSTSITAEAEFDDVDEEGAAGAGSMTTGANPPGIRFSSLAHLPAPFEDEAGANVLATRHLRNHRPGFRNGRENPRPVFVAPPPAALGAGNHRHSSHAAQLTSLIKPI